MSQPPAAPAPDEPERLREAIAALELHRELLGDAAADTALAPLRQRLSLLEEARRLRRAQVTVLFADIVDSTALANRLDAEDALLLFGSCLQRAADCVRARGGRVLRFTGDGLKAAFGTQGAREEDATQAVQAGLDILAFALPDAAQRQRLLGPDRDMALRVGVHTGEVAFGDGFEAGDTLTGDAVNVAARMEQSAPPGSLRISADTWAQVRGRFIADPQPPLQLKGLERPLQTWLVRAAAAVAGPERGIEGLQVAMVGRDEELARLRHAMARSVDSGTLQAISIIGDAGLGKSRLLREALQDLPGGVALLQARADPRDGLRAWGLLRQIVTAHCRIADSDSAEVARGKLLAGLIPALPAGAELEAQLIGQLIGLDFGDAPGLRVLDAQAQRDRALAALLAWLGGLARQSSGLVLVMEDLHSADEASLDALSYLMSHGRSLPLALLMTMRPDLLQRRPAWTEDSTDADIARMVLVPLPAADSDALAAALLPGLRPVPPALHSLLVERAEGNPYYMEELVRRLLDEGVVSREGDQWQFDEERLRQLRLPTTLVGLLQARLDALPAVEREGVQRASIVGHVFWDAALEEISPTAVDAIPGLQQRNWVHRHDPGAFDGTTERRFDHHLLHQVTYGTVLKDDRRRGHAAVARWLAERTEGRGPEFLAITGEHAERAGDDALATDCYLRAAAEAQKRFANALAIDCLQRALALMSDDEVSRRLDALERLCAVADVTGNRRLQGETLDGMMAVLEDYPDPYRRADVTMSRAMLADRQSRLDAAFELATDALAQAIAAGNEVTAALANAELCWLHCLRNNHELAQQHQAAGMVHAGRVRDSRPDLEVKLMYMAGRVAYGRNRMTDFGARMEETLAAAEACGQYRMQLGALESLCVQAEAACDFARASALAARYLALARELGDIRQIGAAHYKVGLSALYRGDVEQALASAALSLAASRACGSMMESHGHYLAGMAHDQRGDAGAARDAYAESAAAYARLEADGIGAARMRALAARQELALGNLAAARDGIDRAMATLGSTDVHVPGSRHNLESGLACAEALATLGDPRGTEILAGLQQRVRTLSLERGGSPEAALDLQQRYPIYRKVMSAAASLPG